MKKQLQLIILILLAVIILLLVQDWKEWLMHTINIGFTLTVVFIGVVIFLENRQPARTISWLLLLTIFPVVGFIFYMIFGRSIRKKRLLKKRSFQNSMNENLEKQDPGIDQSKLSQMGSHQRSLLKLAQKMGQFPVSFATDTEVLTNGKETFAEIFECAEKRTTSYSFRVLYRQK